MYYSYICIDKLTLSFYTDMGIWDNYNIVCSEKLPVLGPLENPPSPLPL